MAAEAGGDETRALAERLRAAIGVTGQFSAVDGLITGEENMLADRIAVLNDGRIAAAVLGDTVRDEEALTLRIPSAGSPTSPVSPTSPPSPTSPRGP